MVDVVICFAGADAAAADRLAKAVARQGYTLWSEDALSGVGAAPASIADRIADAKAAIVIWSEAAAASDWVKAEANFARGQHKLIQASADDRPPPLPFNGAEVESLSNWSGEESHPGWRNIKRRLEALCGRTPATTPASPESSFATAPAAASRKAGGRLLAVLAIVLLALAAAGSFLWMRSQGPLSVQERTAAAPEPRPVPSRPPLDAPVTPPPAADALGALPADEESGEAAGPAPARAMPEPRPGGPRINRRNAENMRRFCQRAGRGTPQCRTFERLLRNQRR